MTLKPTRTEWPIGQDKHQRLVGLVREINGGAETWSLNRQAHSQRDETVILDGLTPGMLVAIGKIAEQEIGDVR